MSPIRIASFNVENLTDDPAAELKLASRLEILRPQLERLDADIVCLQEVDARRSRGGEARRFTALDALLEGTVYEGFERVHTIHEATGEPRDKHNLVIVSRWPIVSHRQYLNDLVPAPTYRTVTAIPPADGAAQIMWDRPVLHAAVQVAGARLMHIFNLHLRAPLAAHVEGQKAGAFVWNSAGGWAEGYFLAAVKRSGQALETRLAIEQVFDSDPQALIAVVGDFNAEEREVPLAIIRGDVEDTGNGELAGRAMVVAEHSLPASRRYTVIHAGRRQMLDHMLVSRPLMAHFRELEVHNEMLGDELVAQTLARAAPDSYHAPIVAEFDLK